MSYSPHEEIHVCEDGETRKIIIECDEHGGRESPLENDDWCEMVTPTGMRAHYGHKQVDGDWLQPDKDGKVPYIHGGWEGYFEDQKPILVLPVGKYEHSGILLYIGKAGSCPWDSGQIGWIWIDAAGFKKVTLKDWEETPENLKRAEELLTSVVDAYSHWVSNDIWGYRIEKLIPECEHGHPEEWITDDDDEYSGCWGYLGDWDKCGVLEDARQRLGVPQKKAA